MPSSLLFSVESVLGVFAEKDSNYSQHKGRTAECYAGEDKRKSSRRCDIDTLALRHNVFEENSEVKPKIKITKPGNKKPERTLM